MDTDPNVPPMLQLTDENATAREIICEILESFSFRPYQSPTGAEVLNDLKKAQQKGDPYQLVIPMIITRMRISTAMSMLAVVGVEMLAADSGIGFLVIDAQRTFATDRMFAGIIVISLMGFTLDRVARLVQSPMLSWHMETSLAGSPHVWSSMKFEKVVLLGFRDRKGIERIGYG